MAKSPIGIHPIGTQKGESSIPRIRRIHHDALLHCHRLVNLPKGDEGRIEIRFEKQAAEKKELPIGSRLEPMMTAADNRRKRVRGSVICVVHAALISRQIDIDYTESLPEYEMDGIPKCRIQVEKLIDSELVLGRDLYGIAHGNGAHGVKWRVSML